MTRLERAILFALFVATVYAANWALERYGTVEVLGVSSLTAPAGVYFAGLAFGFRDALHEAAGRRWVLAAIAAGAVLSYVLSDGATLPGGYVSIAVASAVAFGVSETLDLAVYTPLRDRRWVAAVLLSGAVGAVADSCLFLYLAFGNLENLAGQLVGKALMVALVLPVVYWVRELNAAALEEVPV